jgi:hypothetical protein
MSQMDKDSEAKALPEPITLTPDQLLKIAAGTAGLLPVASLTPIIAGGMPAGPIWAAGGSVTTLT